MPSAAAISQRQPIGGTAGGFLGPSLAQIEARSRFAVPELPHVILQLGVVEDLSA